MERESERRNDQIFQEQKQPRQQTFQTLSAQTITEM